MLSNSVTGDIIYTPPTKEDVIKGLLSNREAFIHNEDDIDPLMKMAAHYQFEAIHPFTDGNGRTGRILHIHLIEQGLLSLPILYLSRYIVQNKQDYYQLLLNVIKDQEWKSWICFMLNAVPETEQWTTQKITAARQLIEHTIEFVRDALPKIYSYELIQIIFEQPDCRISNLVDTGLAKRQTASVYLKQLCDIDVLQETQPSKEKLFLHSKRIQLMTKDSNQFTAYGSI
nr:Fic family protein [uncultured Shewanella sp.]